MSFLARYFTYPAGPGRFSILLNAMNPGDDKAWQPIGVPDDFETLQEFAGTERQPLSTPTPVRDLKGMTYCSCADTPNTYSQGKATA